MAARQAGPASGGQTYLPFICANVSSSIMPKELFRIPFVDANGVAVGIVNHRHVADGRGHRLDAKFHVVLFQLRHRVVEVFHFQSHGAAVRARLEAVRGAEREAVRAEFIFRPLAELCINDLGGFEAEDVLVKFPRAHHVGDGVATKRNFGDFEHDQSVMLNFNSGKTQLFSES